MKEGGEKEGREGERGRERKDSGWVPVKSVGFTGNFSPQAGSQSRPLEGLPKARSAEDKCDSWDLAGLASGTGSGIGL